MERVGGRRYRPLQGHVGLDGFGDIQVHVRGVEGQGALKGFKFDVGQNGNGVALFNDVLHVAQGLHQQSPFDGQFHWFSRFSLIGSMPRKIPAVGGGKSGTDNAWRGSLDTTARGFGNPGESERFDTVRQYSRQSCFGKTFSQSPAKCKIP